MTALAVALPSLAAAAAAAPPDALWMALAAGLAACLALLLWLAFRPASSHSSGEATLLQQQLVGLRAQLASVAQAQQRVPDALAAGREQQQRALSEELSTLAQLVARQLAQAQHATGQRLDETTRAMADVRERLGQVTELAQRMEGDARPRLRALPRRVREGRHAPGQRAAAVPGERARGRAGVGTRRAAGDD